MRDGALTPVDALGQLLGGSRQVIGPFLSDDLFVGVRFAGSRRASESRAMEYCLLD